MLRRPASLAVPAPACVALADAECIVSVIVLMVARLEKDANLAETASKLASSIGKQVHCSAAWCSLAVAQQSERAPQRLLLEPQNTVSSECFAQGFMAMHVMYC